MSTVSTLTVTPILVAQLLARDGRMPVFVHVIDHPDGRVLVDTGMTQLHPAVADMDPLLTPLSEQAFDLASIDLVVNTDRERKHLRRADHLPDRPTFVQRRELDDARSLNDYTIPEWVDAPGVQYVPVDGEFEVLPGINLLPTPGHTRGSQVVVVDVAGRPIVIAGDTAVFHAELDDARTEAQRLVVGLDPEAVWLSHEYEPWRPKMAEKKPRTWREVTGLSYTPRDLNPEPTD
ncbi:MAG: MBL fold metallo-hydrolase [Pseudolysinimonas sp.]